MNERAHADALEKLAQWEYSAKYDDIQFSSMKERAERAEAELADHARWLDEMVADYRLMADPHTVSKRLAINALIHDQRAELAAERERADRNQEDAERWRAAKQMFEAGYEMEDGEPAIALFLPEHLDPNAAIDAARRK